MFFNSDGNRFHIMPGLSEDKFNLQHFVKKSCTFKYIMTIMIKRFRRYTQYMESKKIFGEINRNSDWQMKKEKSCSPLFPLSLPATIITLSISKHQYRESSSFYLISVNQNIFTDRRARGNAIVKIFSKSHNCEGTK